MLLVFYVLYKVVHVSFKGWGFLYQRWQLFRIKLKVFLLFLCRGVIKEVYFQSHCTSQEFVGFVDKSFHIWLFSGNGNVFKRISYVNYLHYVFYCVNFLWICVRRPESFTLPEHLYNWRSLHCIYIIHIAIYWGNLSKIWCHWSIFFSFLTVDALKLL